MPWIAELLQAVCLLLTALIWTDPQSLASLPPIGGRLLLAVAPVGAVLLVRLLWSLPRPVGLELDPAGLHGVRAGPRVDLSWDRLTKATPGGKPGLRRPPLLLWYGDKIKRIYAPAHGGDTYAIAAVIEYYRLHPDQRHRLTSVAAVQHVADQSGRAGSP
ncbi:MAG: hypothetical protein ACK5H2_10495 [Beutenbergiaceae bacterium]